VAASPATTAAAATDVRRVGGGTKLPFDESDDMHLCQSTLHWTLVIGACQWLEPSDGQAVPSIRANLGPRRVLRH
jgi:hypothetical protein